MNKVKLSWLFNTISSGTTPPSNKDEYYDNGTINWLNTGDLNDGFVYDIPKKVTFKALGDFSTLKIYKPNSIVMAMYGATIGKLGIINQEFCTNQACVVLSNPKKNVNFKFIYYCLISKREDIINKANGGGQPNISQSIVKNIRIGLPDKKSQEMIAEFLDKKLEMINDLIQAKETQIELLEEQRQAMITEAVTKGLNPNVKMKNSGVEWIGEIPEHWEVKKIKHLSQVKRGASPRPIDDPKYYAEDGDYSWVRISDVTKSGKYLFNTRDKLSELGASKSVKRHRGDLFLSIAATVGKACITKIDCCIHDGFVYFDNLKVEEEYLFYIFEAGQCYRGLGKMGTQLNLNTDTVGNITIPVSSRKEIQEIIDYIINKDVEFLNLINAVKRSKEKLKEYRQSLIHEAVTGKILIEEMEAYIKEAEKNGD